MTQAKLSLIVLAVVFAIFFAASVINLRGETSTDIRTSGGQLRSFEEINSTSKEPLAQPIDIAFHEKYCLDHYGGGHRGHAIVRLLKYQTRSMFILDVGGFKGTTTFPALVCFPIHHRAITVEPIALNRAAMLNHSRLLGLSQPSYQWRLVSGAFSNVTGQTDIYVPMHRTDNTALNSVTATANVGGETVKMTIDTFKGDDLLYDAGERPDFIKIDVQGAELLVMQGLDKIISENRDMVVYSEFDPGLMGFYNFRREDPTAFMVERGFKTYCSPDFFVRDGVFYARNESAALSVEDIRTKREVEIYHSQNIRCDDLVYVKNIKPNPGPPTDVAWP